MRPGAELMPERKLEALRDDRACALTFTFDMYATNKGATWETLLLEGDVLG